MVLYRAFKYKPKLETLPQMDSSIQRNVSWIFKAEAPWDFYAIHSYTTWVSLLYDVQVRHLGWSDAEHDKKESPDQVNKKDLVEIVKQERRPSMQTTATSTSKLKPKPIKPPLWAQHKPERPPLSQEAIEAAAEKAEVKHCWSQSYLIRHYPGKTVISGVGLQIQNPKTDETMLHSFTTEIRLERFPSAISWRVECHDRHHRHNDVVWETRFQSVLGKNMQMVRQWFWCR